jgi:carbon-monoxide dehydrogenase small subunit
MEVTVNGTRHRVVVPSHRSLLQFLRNDVGLTGTKECCSVGECGACTVEVDGRAVNACLVLAVEVDGREVTTIEGLGIGGQLSALQDAFLTEGAVQCGFCIPGMVMAADALLRRSSCLSRAEVQEALSGNLCRCGGYERIVKAVLRAAGAVRQ